MHLIKIHNSDSKGFAIAWELYESSFPSDERRTLSAQREVFNDGRYDFFTVEIDEEVVAILAVWDLGDFLFIEHFAVIERLRGSGVGTKLLQEYLSMKNKKIVLEVEHPKTVIAKKRIRFYERLGFNLNSFEFIQPPYDKNKDSVSLLLMTYPGGVDESVFSLIKQKLYSIVYGDV